MTEHTALVDPALAAYGRALERAKDPAQSPDASSSAPNFAALLEQGVRDAIEAGHQSEAASTQALTGQASLQGVVEAVNAAELTLQTVVAVRDRMISAYQEILRMPL